MLVLLLLLHDRNAIVPFSRGISPRVVVGVGGGLLKLNAWEPHPRRLYYVSMLYCSPTVKTERVIRIESVTNICQYYSIFFIYFCVLATSPRFRIATASLCVCIPFRFSYELSTFDSHIIVSLFYTFLIYFPG